MSIAIGIRGEHTYTVRKSIVDQARPGLSPQARSCVDLVIDHSAEENLAKEVRVPVVLLRGEAQPAERLRRVLRDSSFFRISQTECVPGVPISCLRILTDLWDSGRIVVKKDVRRTEALSTDPARSGSWIFLTLAVTIA